MQSGGLSCPPGYLYAPAHCWTALAEGILPEPIPTPIAPQAMPLTNTQNPPVQIRTPFDALIVGVAGWAIPQTPLPSQITVATRQGMEMLSCSSDGRDLFATRWTLNGDSNYSTDGTAELLEPAAVVVGSRLLPRKLGWLLPRNQVLSVYFRNLSNLLDVVPLVAGNPAGFPISAAVTFYAVNLEAS